MNQDRYPFTKNNNHLIYEFESEGPIGKIKKVVRFKPECIGGTTFFSIGFGDFDEKTGKPDDKIVSNNHDRNKVLTTVAQVVLEFTKHFPDMDVYAEGSTTSRTRLYQMGIAKNLQEISNMLEVYGMKNGTWELFKKDVNYDAFLVRRKT